MLDALEKAFERFGAPKHIISDQGSIFTGAAMKELLGAWNVKHRFGAVGKNGSVAVTERVIKTLKEEWLRRVPLIRGFDHLEELCAGFVDWYNDWRPHMTLDGARPEDVYAGREIKRPARDAKAVPPGIERRCFKDVGITGYRLKDAA